MAELAVSVGEHLERLMTSYDLIEGRDIVKINRYRYFAFANHEQRDRKRVVADCSAGSRLDAVDHASGTFQGSCRIDQSENRLSGDRRMGATGHRLGKACSWNFIES